MHMLQGQHSFRKESCLQLQKSISTLYITDIRLSLSLPLSQLTHTQNHSTIMCTVVSVGFTNDILEVNESEGEAKLCVSISHIIARPLKFEIIHDSFTSGTPYVYITIKR